MNYYTTIAFFTISINLMLIVIASLNKYLNPKTRNGFIVAFLFIMVGSIIELIGTLENINTSLNMFTKLIKFSIIPLMPFVSALTVFETPNKSSGMKFLKVYLAIYEIFIYIEYFTYNLKIFYNITSQIYIISFIITSIYMFFKAFEFSDYYPKKNKIELLLIIIFTFIGVSVGAINPDMKISWITITVASAFMYIYYDELLQCIDGLTTLLNKRSFDNYIATADEEIVIIVLDVNDFKLVNDSKGHKFGDEILCMISQLLKENYQDYGKCYRIGGDEFVVILVEQIKEINKVEELNRRFINSIITKRSEIPELPLLSYGMAKYDPKNKTKFKNATAAFVAADKEMYANKTQAKQKQT